MSEATHSHHELQDRFLHHVTQKTMSPILKAHAQDLRDDFCLSVDRGLRKTPPALECRFLYDAKGSRIFEAICDQPEYYPTRTEAAILQRCAHEIRQITGPVNLVEFGSGLSVKTRYLLDAWTHHSPDTLYVPVDVSDSALKEACAILKQRYPRLRPVGIHGTYEQAFPVLKTLSPSLVLFLGSTLGNFNPHETERFLARLAQAMKAGDHFLLGVDLVKDPDILEAAYNDAEGVTAAFTTNLFARINRDLSTTIDLEALEHQAHWNPAKEQIELDILTHEDQVVALPHPGETHWLPAGTRVRVEISRKFRVDGLNELLNSLGFETEKIFTDEQDWFAVLLLRRNEKPSIRRQEASQ